MPAFSLLWLNTTLCPNCKQQCEVPGGVIKFQWGKIPHEYKIGDSVIWLTDSSGEVLPPGKTIEIGRGHNASFRWNLGETKYSNLYVFDTDPNIAGFQCSECNKHIDHLVVEIRQK